MTDAQRRMLLALMGTYVDWAGDPHVTVRREEVAAHVDETWFSWYGGFDDEAPFYYRVHSPVILIEFDHQTPANLRQLAANPNVPNHEHIHVVVRTPNGNDYGKDLLRQHYAQHRHTAAYGVPQGQ